MAEKKPPVYGLTERVMPGKRSKPSPVNVAALVGLGPRRGYTVVLRVHVGARDHVAAVEKVLRYSKRRAFKTIQVERVIDCRKGFERPLPKELTELRGT